MMEVWPGAVMRCRRKYSPLFSFQKRLRHVRGLCLRNMRLPTTCATLKLELRNEEGALLGFGDVQHAQGDSSWWKVKVIAGQSSKCVVVHVLADGLPFIEWTIHLSGLVFVSRHPPNQAVQFALNSILLLFSEGVYCDKSCFSSIPELINEARHLKPDRHSQIERSAFQTCTSDLSAAGEGNQSVAKVEGSSAAATNGETVRTSSEIDAVVTSDDVCCSESAPVLHLELGGSSDALHAFALDGCIGNESECKSDTRGGLDRTDVNSAEDRSSEGATYLDASIVERRNLPHRFMEKNGKVYVCAKALCDVRERIVVDSRRVRKSYGVNALNRLSTMERALRRTVANANDLRASLEERIAARRNEASYSITCQIENLRVRCRALRCALDDNDALLRREAADVARLQEAIDKDREELELQTQNLKHEKERLEFERNAFFKEQEELKGIALFRRQVQLICELNDYIYPLVQVPNGSGYTICSVLVQSIEDQKNPKKRVDDQMTSTGMAYVFHLVSLLSLFTGVPLIFPLKYDRNDPVIVDVSIDSFCQKEFPLWIKSKDRLYFEHAVGLLARNVAQLRVHYGLSSMRGRLMPGLYGLIGFFRKKQLEFERSACGSSSTHECTDSTSVSLRDSTRPSEPDSSVSSSCGTPVNGSLGISGKNLRASLPDNIHDQGRLPISRSLSTSVSSCRDIVDPVESGSTGVC